MKNKVTKFICLFIILSFLVGVLVLTELKGGQQAVGQEKENVEQKTQSAERTASVNPTPKALFLAPGDGEVITETTKIELKVENAQSVEFYIQRPEDMLPIYLGQGSKKENRWRLELRPLGIPNGEYELFAQITNDIGQYNSGKKKITVKARVKHDTQKDAVVREEVKQASQEIKNQEAAIETAKQEVMESGVEAPVVEDFVETVSREQTLEKQITKATKESSAIESAVSQTEEEINQLPGNPVGLVKEDKQAILKSHQSKKAETEKRIAVSKSSLKEAKEKKEEIKTSVSAEKQNELQKLEELVIGIEKAKTEQTQFLTKDTDQDGLTDQEEIRLGTSPVNPDSDEDGFLDGTETQAGYDPLKLGPDDKVIYQDPQKVPPQKTDTYKVERIEKIEILDGRSGLKFVGQAIPNSFVTLYVFSLPLIVVVKADSNGRWEYTLDKPLPDGEHKVYAAVTNNRGQVEARSEVFVFYKAGEKVFRIFQSPEAALVSPAAVLQKSFGFLIVSIVMLALGIALTIIGIITRRKAEKAKIQ